MCDVCIGNVWIVGVATTSKREDREQERKRAYSYRESKHTRTHTRMQLHLQFSTRYSIKYDGSRLQLRVSRSDRGKAN
jgi:hypothetical protein